MPTYATAVYSYNLTTWWDPEIYHILECLQVVAPPPKAGKLLMPDQQEESSQVSRYFYSKYCSDTSELSSGSVSPWNYPSRSNHHAILSWALFPVCLQFPVAPAHWPNNNYCCQRQTALPNCPPFLHHLPNRLLKMKMQRAARFQWCAGLRTRAWQRSYHPAFAMIFLSLEQNDLRLS
jgi:hypothetical protein